MSEREKHHTTADEHHNNDKVCASDRVLGSPPGGTTAKSVVLPRPAREARVIVSLSSTQMLVGHCWQGLARESLTRAVQDATAPGCMASLSGLSVAFVAGPFDLPALPELVQEFTNAVQWADCYILLQRSSIPNPTS